MNPISSNGSCPLFINLEACPAGFDPNDLGTFDESRKVTSLDYYRDSYTKAGSTEDKIRKQTRLAAAAPNDKFEWDDCFLTPKSLQLRLIGDVRMLFHLSKCWGDGKAGLAIKQGRSEEDHGSHMSLEIKTADHSCHADFYAIFDGHGDKKKCSEFLEVGLPLAIKDYLSREKELNDETITSAITSAVKLMELTLISPDEGSTVTGLLQFRDKSYLFNVGDSRGILVKEEEVYQLTEDPVPNSERFERAVKKMGNTVECDGFDIPRVNGCLNMGRDIGTEYISAQPKISRLFLKADHKPGEGLISYQEGDCVVLATDGFWDMLSNNEVAQAIREFSKLESSAERVAQLLVQEAHGRWMMCAPSNRDDISVMVVKF